MSGRAIDLVRRQVGGVPLWVGAAGVVAAIGLLYIVTRKGVAKGAGQAVGGAAVDLVSGVLSGVDAALPEPIRPSSDQNVVYGTVNFVPRVVTGDPSWTLGGWLYDITHPDPMKMN